MDRKTRDALVAASDAQSLILDFLSDVVKVEEALVEVQKLAKLLRCEVRGSRGRGNVHELEDEGTTSDDALPSR